MRCMVARVNTSFGKERARWAPAAISPDALLQKLTEKLNLSDEQVHTILVSRQNIRLPK